MSNLGQHRELAMWAAACAERVLTAFGAERPDDDRPRMAVDAARAWARGDISCAAAREAAFAAHAAARAATDPAARAAARAAGHAAATAHVAGHARHAAAYAVASVAETGAIAAQAERAWQRTQLPPSLVSVA